MGTDFLGENSKSFFLTSSNSFAAFCWQQQCMPLFNLNNACHFLAWKLRLNLINQFRNLITLTKPEFTQKRESFLIGFRFFSFCVTSTYNIVQILLKTPTIFCKAKPSSSGAKPGVLPPGLGFSMSFWVSGFFSWRSGDFRIYLRSGDATYRVLFITLFISSLIFLYLVLSRYLSLQHNWWTSNWHRISCKYQLCTQWVQVSEILMKQAQRKRLTGTHSNFKVERLKHPDLKG